MAKYSLNVKMPGRRHVTLPTKLIETSLINTMLIFVSNAHFSIVIIITYRFI